MIDQQPDSLEKPKPDPGTGKQSYTFSPVTVTDTVGAVFLSIISIILIIALLRTLARNRQLEVELARQT